MSRPPDRGGGLPPGSTASNSSMTSAWAVGGGDANDVKMRSFAEIIAAEKTQRNILDIHIIRIASTEDIHSKPKSLTFDNLGELIFDILSINPDNCIGYNYNSEMYDTKEIKFKPGIDLSPYIKSSFEFKGHKISTKKQIFNVTKVSFRNVPFNVPDEEIIQLCNSYGKPLNKKVYYEKLFNFRNRGMMGSTRWVEMELNEGCCMNNFYWLEGPLQGDTGARITVLHNGQEQQCSNCLKTGRGGCRAQGNGKACAELKTPRTKMSDYMAELKRLVGYESLKSQYLQQFPSLQAENMINMEERLSGEEDEEEEELLPSNPIQRRDARVAELEKNTEEVSSMKEQMTKLNAE